MFLLFVIITHLLQITSASTDFVERFENLDGEVITRLQYNNKSVLQTSYAGYNLIEVCFHLQRQIRWTTKTRFQSADPGTFIQMWYSGSELIDCTVETDSPEIGNFLRNFNSKSCPDVNHKNGSCRRWVTHVLILWYICNSCISRMQGWGSATSCDKSDWRGGRSTTWGWTTRDT